MGVSLDWIVLLLGGDKGSDGVLLLWLLEVALLPTMVPRRCALTIASRLLTMRGQLLTSSLDVILCSFTDIGFFIVASCCCLAGFPNIVV